MKKALVIAAAGAVLLAGCAQTPGGGKHRDGRQQPPEHQRSGEHAGVQADADTDAVREGRADHHAAGADLHLRERPRRPGQRSPALRYRFVVAR